MLQFLFYGMIEIDFISELSEFRRLRSAWNELLKSQPSENMVFLTHEWFHCWWKRFSKASHLYVIVAKDNDKIIGIAPLMIRKVFFRGLPVKLVSFIENGNSLHNNFIVDKARRTKVLQAIIEELFRRKQEWDLIEINNIPEDSLNIGILRDILIKKSILFAEKNGLNSPYLKIELDWESYLKRRSGKSRKTLRNIQNRFKKQGDFLIQRIDDLEGYEKVKPQLYDIARNSWMEEIGDSLNSPANRLFFDELSHAASERGWLIIWLLQLNGEPIAFEYHLKYKGKVHALRASHKKTYSNMSPGVFLDYHIIKHLFESRDIDEYDLGGSADFYKRKWTKDHRNHINVHIFKKSIYSRLLYLYEYALIPLIKRLVRRKKGQGSVRLIKNKSLVFDAHSIRHNSRAFEHNVCMGRVEVN